MGKKLISSDEAVTAKAQHTNPCSDCPWRRDSLPGWLGSGEPDDWIRAAHADQVITCHVICNQQCAGIAIYRANVCKSARKPNLRLPVDKDSVFAWPTEFLAHHQ